MTTHRSRRIGLGLLGAGGLARGLGAGPAGAHVSPSPGEVPAGGYTAVSFTVPHGCDDSPTTKLAFSIPEGIDNAAPQVVPGWDVATAEEPLAEPKEGEGEPQTERVSEITFTAQPGNELPSAYREVFTIGFKAPDAEDDTLVFPVVQTCTEGSTDWIEETVEGEEEPEHPAPFVTVGAAEGDGHGHDSEDAAAAGEPIADEAAVGTASTGGSDDGDDSSSNGLAIAGLVLGALGLAAGGTALIRTRSAG